MRKDIISWREENERGFTIMELMLVLIIVSILVALALPQYSGHREHTLGKEVQAQLKLIISAEKLYRLEMGDFYPTNNISDINAINENLSLSLIETNWNYTIDRYCGPECVNVSAQRNSTDSKYSGCVYWYMYNTSMASMPVDASKNNDEWCP
ncbi:MAG: prepilin-type N-terminal cleavage/methylation domain-containing protein [Candidatus Omnitrophica bacterium]|nr:prepilin-type N-terminal cleavage/methylation domain-containing protein [Candidatus Omnitrophota bacterium]